LRLFNPGHEKAKNMILVLLLSALVIGGMGAGLGLVLARFFPKPVLYVLWAALAAGAVYQVVQINTADEYERAGATIVLFAVLGPLLVGSLITGILVRRRENTAHSGKPPE
jgi:predicted permease